MLPKVLSDVVGERSGPPTELGLALVVSVSLAYRDQYFSSASATLLNDPLIPTLLLFINWSISNHGVSCTRLWYEFVIYGDAGAYQHVYHPLPTPGRSCSVGKDQIIYIGLQNVLPNSVLSRLLCTHFHLYNKSLGGQCRVRLCLPAKRSS